MISVKTGFVTSVVLVCILLLHFVYSQATKIDAQHTAVGVCRSANAVEIDTSRVKNGVDFVDNRPLVDYPSDASDNAHWREELNSVVSGTIETDTPSLAGSPILANAVHGEQKAPRPGAGEGDSVDEWVSYEYDQDGAPVREIFDRDGDGIPEASLAVQRDESKTEERWELDYNGDGVADSVYTSRFDHFENTLRQEVDMNGDGIADKLYLSTYDTSGKRIRREVDSDGDGAIDEVQINEYYGSDRTSDQTPDDRQEDAVIAETALFINFMSDLATHAEVMQ